MKNIKTIFQEKFVVRFTAIVCIFHMVLGLVHYFLPVKNLYPFDYALIIIAIMIWIFHLIIYGIKPHLGNAFIILAVLFFWYLISCQVMTDTYYRNWFSYNKDYIYDTLLLIGLVFPIGIYMGRKGFDTFIQTLIHIVVFAWTGFMIFVLIHVFQNKIINTPSGGQIGMSRNIALCLNTHYNTTGVIELSMLIIVLYLIFNSHSRILRIVYVLPCLVHMITLVLSNSRTAFVAFVIISAASVFSFVYNAKWEISLPKRLLLGTAAAIITVLFLLIFREFVYSMHEKFTHLKELVTGTIAETSSARDLTSTRSIKSRIQIWKSSLQAMVVDEKRFIFGVTPVSVPSVITDASNGKFENLYTHNQFLEIGVSLGIPGLILFILFVALLAKNSFMISIKNNKGLKAWISVSIVVTLLIANLTEATLMFYRYMSSYLFFLFSGWICSSADLGTVKKESRIKRKNSLKRK